MEARIFDERELETALDRARARGPSAGPGGRDGRAGRDGRGVPGHLRPRHQLDGGPPDLHPGARGEEAHDQVVLWAGEHAARRFVERLR